MDEKIKSAFNEIKADQTLKLNTKEYLFKRIRKHEKKRNFRRYGLILAPACFAVVLLACFGLISYNIPVSAVSIDINPSIELGVNRYNRVISAESFNDDGEKILNAVSIKNMECNEAVDMIVNQSNQYLDSENTVVVTVESESDEKTEMMIESIEHCKSHNNEMYCYKGNSDVVEEAHSLGLSFGKYSAYLQLKEYNSSVTVDDIKGMTMREIKEEIDQYASSGTSGDNDNITESNEFEPTSAEDTGGHRGRHLEHHKRNNCENKK